MSMPFKFGEYTLRPIEEKDRPMLTAWIEQDQFHAGRILPDFFLRNVPGEDSWALEDGHGYVVFYFKTQTAVRLHIQFGGMGENEVERERNRKAMTEGLDWLEAQLRSNGFREIGFQTSNPVLGIFARTSLGFISSRGEMIRTIPWLQ